MITFRVTFTYSKEFELVVLLNAASATRALALAQVAALPEYMARVNSTAHPNDVPELLEIRIEVLG